MPSSAAYGIRRRLLRAVLLAALAVLAAGLLCLALFLRDLALFDPAHRPSGDGIVVLTGGRDRVDAGVDLLTEQRGRRLLISGVNPSTSAEAIRRTVDARRELFACCVDLGRRAETTTGNAVETADWIAEHKFRSVVLVTSAYHAPRALLELRAELAVRGLDVTVAPYHVHPVRLALADLVEHPDLARTLAAECAKYTLARLRILAEATRRLGG